VRSQCAKSSPSLANSGISPHAKFRFPSGQVQLGIAHGNLSLDSLLIAKNQNGTAGNGFNNSATLSSEILNTDFFIYVCDLALWESLFDPKGDWGQGTRENQNLTVNRNTPITHHSFLILQPHKI
jgi:hypothetical protein